MEQKPRYITTIITTASHSKSKALCISVQRLHNDQTNVWKSVKLIQLEITVNGPDLRQQPLALAHPINAALFLFSCGKLKTSAKL